MYGNSNSWTNYNNCGTNNICKIHNYDSKTCNNKCRNNNYNNFRNDS